MTTKSILFAILAALPIVARAENISGAMYIAPSAADNNHPAPTTNANAPYGRVNIDTADQDHIATTAYVKGAYNSAVAAVNTVADDVSSLWGYVEGDYYDDMANRIDNKQAKLQGMDTGNEIDTDVVETQFFDDVMRGFGGGDISALRAIPENSLITAEAVAAGVDAYVGYYMSAHPITIYTTWDDDSANATTQVSLTSAN